jgi:hypothetical protein
MTLWQSVSSQVSRLNIVPLNKALSLPLPLDDQRITNYDGQRGDQQICSKSTPLPGGVDLSSPLNEQSHRPIVEETSSLAGMHQ